MRRLPLSECLCAHTVCRILATSVEKRRKSCKIYVHTYTYGSAARFTAVRTCDRITWRSVPRCGNCGYKFMRALQQSLFATATRCSQTLRFLDSFLERTPMPNVMEMRQTVVVADHSRRTDGRGALVSSFCYFVRTPNGTRTGEIPMTVSGIPQNCVPTFDACVALSFRRVMFTVPHE